MLERDLLLGRKEKLLPCQSAVGCFIDATVGRRPDLAQAVGTASPFMSNPRNQHWVAVKQIMLIKHESGKTVW